jgi:hypothetical protein
MNKINFNKSSLNKKLDRKANKVFKKMLLKRKKKKFCNHKSRNFQIKKIILNKKKNLNPLFEKENLIIKEKKIGFKPKNYS